MRSFIGTRVEARVASFTDDAFPCDTRDTVNLLINANKPKTLLG